MTEYTLKIPTSRSETAAKEITLSAGQHLFVLGPNGSGKSSLMHRIYAGHRDNCVRLSAHRQTWLRSDSLNLSPQARRESEKNLRQRDARDEARWKDEDAAVRANIALYDLIDAQNVRAREITTAFEAGNLDRARELASVEAPIATINQLMQLAGLPIILEIHKHERIQARKSGSDPYSIAELSDGERNALLLAASVLTADAGSLILVDEPERHLHRSIISPLLTHLFARRTECIFVVSTHEVQLPIDHPDASTILVRACAYTGKQPSGWEIDVLDGSVAVPEGMKTDILGSRSRVLFIEGTEDSMDKPLYSILFPDVSIIAKGSCAAVEHATIGVRSTAACHWVEAFGLVDGDGRTDTELERLSGHGICATPCYSVESLYYDLAVLRVVAERVAELDGSSPDDRMSTVHTALLETIAQHKARLCARLVNRRIRDSVTRQIPTIEPNTAATDLSIDVPIASLLAEEEERFDKAIADNDVALLVQRYPVRETPALTRAAAILGFQNRRDYEAAVIKACTDSQFVPEIIMKRLGILALLLDSNDTDQNEQVG